MSNNKYTQFLFTVGEDKDILRGNILRQVKELIFISEKLNEIHETSMKIYKKYIKKPHAFPKQTRNNNNKTVKERAFKKKQKR